MSDDADELAKLKEENRRLRLLHQIRPIQAHTVSMGPPPNGAVHPDQKAVIIAGIEKRFGFINEAKTPEERTAAINRYFAVIRSALSSSILSSSEAEEFVGKVQV